MFLTNQKNIFKFLSQTSYESGYILSKLLNKSTILQQNDMRSQGFRPKPSEVILLIKRICQKCWRTQAELWCERRITGCMILEERGRQSPRRQPNLTPLKAVTATEKPEDVRDEREGSSEKEIKESAHLHQRRALTDHHSVSNRGLHLKLQTLSVWQRCHNSRPLRHIVSSRLSPAWVISQLRQCQHGYKGVFVCKKFLTLAFSNFGTAFWVFAPFFPVSFSHSH